MTDYPTVANPAEYNAVGSVRGHAWVYTTADGWRIEHCVDGRWGACDLVIYAVRDDDERDIRRAVLRHLRRKPHKFEHRPELCGTHHAGGGHTHDGRWIKGPKR